MNNINELMYAYVLGCLGHEEIRFINEQLNSGEDFNKKELGEFQNLAALLPSILEIETPDSNLKDLVAIKLHKLKDEQDALKQKNAIPEIIQEEIKEVEEAAGIETEDLSQPETEQNILSEQTIIDESDAGEVPQEISTSDEESLSNRETNIPKEQIIDDSFADFFKQTDTPPKDNISSDTFQFEKKSVRRTSPRKEESVKEKIPSTPMVVPTKKRKRLMISGIVLIYLLVIGIIIVYWRMTSRINSLYEEIEGLKRQVIVLDNQLNSYRDVRDMLQSPDLILVSLKGTTLNPHGYGKIFLSFDNGNGYIQFSRMPAIAEDKLFQLWVKVQGKTVSPGVFQTYKGSGFYSFKLNKLPTDEILDFFITAEPLSGSTVPGYKVYLTGSYSP